MTDTSKPDVPANSLEDVLLDAEQAAAGLGLSTELFWSELKRGIVYGTVERGQGADAGRSRLTLRYRARTWRIVLG